MVDVAVAVGVGDGVGVGGAAISGKLLTFRLVQAA